MTKLYGLVVCGGQSSRMGGDKSKLIYHGKEQRYHLYEMLQPYCEKVFISCNASQADDIPASYLKIVDEEKYENIGPMAGLASAFDRYPEASFLVIGCDYPFLQRQDIDLLVMGRNNETTAISLSNSDIYYEPLIAVYESFALTELNNYIINKQYSLNQFLKGLSALKIAPTRPDAIQSVDSITAYEMAKKQIENGGYGA